MPATPTSPRLYSIVIQDGLAILQLEGDWRVTAPHPVFSDAILEPVISAGIHKIEVQADGVGRWDSSLLVFCRACHDCALAADIEFDIHGLPKGVQNLIKLSLAVPPNELNTDAAQNDLLSRIGQQTVSAWKGLQNYFEFLGLVLFAIGALLVGRAKFRLKDLLIILQNNSSSALPIVALLNALTGLIIAFIGVIQLQKFAADIYVADLVGLATARELAAVITGVIMAGRTGAAFAAQIGSMQVNEEIDALKTSGVSPIQFLVLPRVVAMVCMMPLLCIFANVVSMLGGLVVAVAISDVSTIQYANQIKAAVSVTDFLFGVFKSGIFGFIIAFAGCYRGLNCGRSASSVGFAATSAVVTSITWIVIADAIFAVLSSILGI